jgi:ribosomal peptide maturation radical SAM protein 1
MSSLATALLATYLREQGIDCREAYLHFELVRLLGKERYFEVVKGMNGLVGELLFAEGLHGKLTSPEMEARLTELFGTRSERSQLLDAFEARALERLCREQPDLVGISTSLNQLMPALWLASLIKRHAPGTRVVLGGAACTEPMGSRLVTAYPDIDWVVSGYGEQPLLKLARGASPPVHCLSQTLPIELDDSPIPDYEPFLRELSQVDPSKKPLLTFESSRGCWWGQRQPCTFCGLNGPRRAYFTKSSARVVTEIRTLWERHGCYLWATDTIMPREHFEQVLPALSAEASGPKLFWEIKANLRQPELAALSRARVQGLQPGIESLSSRLLGLVGKGTKAIHNLALLKWCREYHVAVTWNQLYGIPGETPEDYRQQIALMQRIVQLPPPERINPIRIDRYSRYFAAYRDFGWTALKPLPEYASMHPGLDPEGLQEVAYHFEGVGGLSCEAYLEDFRSGVSEWQRRNTEGQGLFLDPVQGLVRNDSQSGFRFELKPVLKRVLDCTHDVVPVSRVLERADCSRALLDKMVAHGLLFIEDEMALNLAVRTQVPQQGAPEPVPQG